MAEIYRPDPKGQKTPSSQKGGAGKPGAPNPGKPGAPNPRKPGAPNPGKKPKPRSKGFLAFVIIASVAAALILAYCGYALFLALLPKDPVPLEYATHIDPPTETGTLEPVTIEFPEERNGKLNKDGLPLICDTHAVKNILLIGIDARAKGNEAGLSDSMMILSINSELNTITLFSIERDLVVKIPGHGYQKLNAAHAYGGPELLMETLKENFNIEIESWAKVNFYSFVDIVDAVGGLDVEMSASEIHWMNFYLLEINELYRRPYGTDNMKEEAGTYHLNGHQALAFCRNRYTDSDFGRMRRQRYVIDLVVQKAKTLNLSQLNHLLTTVLPLITTNIPAEERYAMIAGAPGYVFYQLTKGSVPEDDAWKGGGDPKHPELGSVVIFLDKQASLEKLYNTIYGVEPETAETEQ